MRSVKIQMNKKTKALVAAGVLVTATAGGAYAYWSSTGAGAGSASTGTSSPFAVTTDTASGGLLTPGGPTQTVAFHVTNNNSGVQRLSTVTVTVATSTGAAWTSVAGCSAADYTVGTPAFTPGDVASNATKDGTVTITMNNLATSQDGCKGAVVPLYVSAS
jgi:hypothetical protein